MPTTRPGYVWSAATSEWIEIGQAAVVSPFKYQSTQPSSAATGDIWIDENDDVPSIDSSLFYRWKKTAVGGETSLSGNDDASLPLTYTVGYEELYINGVLQVRASDYTATTGNTITGLIALSAGDIVTIMSQVAYTVGDTYTQTAADARFVNRNVGGLNLVVPTSVTGVTVSANGQVTIGSAVSSVTVNGAFNSTYDNYRIVIGGVDATSRVNFRLQFGSTTNEHYGSVYFDSYDAASIGTERWVNAANMIIGIAGTGDDTSSSCDVYSPNLVKRTTLSGTYNTFYFSGWYGGGVNTTTQYTSFTILVGGGATLTGGTIRIYGYNNGA